MFIFETLLEMVIGAIVELGVDATWEKTKQNERFIRSLKRLGINLDEPPPDFNGVYVHTLIEYGVGKPAPLLHLFRHRIVRDAFREFFDTRDDSMLRTEIDTLVEIEAITGLRRLDINPHNEIAEFAKVFKQKVARTITPAEVEQMHKLDDIHGDVKDVPSRTVELIAGQQKKSNKLEHSQLWQLELAEFDDCILDMIDENQSASLRRFIRSSMKEFTALSSPESPELLKEKTEQIHSLLDHMTVLGSILIDEGMETEFVELRDAFYQIVKRANHDYFPEHIAHVFLEVVKRIYVLGGLLVYRKRFDWVSILVQQSLGWESDPYNKKFLWIRHIQIIVSRHGIVAKSLCNDGVDLIENTAHFAKLFFDDLDEAGACVYQFDFLQCVHQTVKAGDYRSAYPSFGSSNKHYTEPIVVNLITESTVRSAIPEIPDAQLAKIIQELDHGANQQFWFIWDDPWSEEIRRFLSQHLAR